MENQLEEKVKELEQRLKQTEDALLESEKNFRLIVESSPDFIIQVDLKGRIIFANKAYLEYFGLNPNRYKGKSYLSFVHSDYKKEPKNAVF